MKDLLLLLQLLHCCLPCTVLCWAALYCTVLCCVVLCCAVLCCAVLCCAVLCCAVLCWLFWAGLGWAGLCCAVLCCAVLNKPYKLAAVLFLYWCVCPRTNSTASTKLNPRYSPQLQTHACMVQVLDECHHCLKDSPYSHIMQHYYKKLSPQEQAHTQVRPITCRNALLPAGTPCYLQVRPVTCDTPCYLHHSICVVPQQDLIQWATPDCLCLTPWEDTQQMNARCEEGLAS